MTEDAEGCQDLKLFPRVEGCKIVECGAKQHDATSIQNSDSSALDLATNSVTYSCPVSIDLKRIERNVDSLLHKNAYQTVAEDHSDPLSIGATARKGGQWVRWSAGADDGANTYSVVTGSVVTGDSATNKLKTETCNEPQIFSLQSQCAVLECSSKTEDAVEIRTNHQEQSSLEGPLRTVTLACPASSAAQVFESARKELKESGFDILFADIERSESSWLSARSGKRWVELVGTSDAESMFYALTVLPAAEAVLPVKPSSTAPLEGRPTSLINTIANHASLDNITEQARLAPPEAEPPKQVQPAPPPHEEPSKETVSPAVVSSSEPSFATPIPAPRLFTPATAAAELIPPKPILQVPMEVSHDLRWSIAGQVVISMLVDVNQEGIVTKAIVTGKVTNDVEKLQSAAVDAIYRWRFEPAHKGDQRVPAQTEVQLRFEGRPWRY